ncbi:MAG: hypothetical protein JWS08_01665 [Phormidium sp. PBR-2020]|nr:MAG: hypothetical protein JWS08_01665 [Phormidium sp. PBR-2020]
MREEGNHRVTEDTEEEEEGEEEEGEGEEEEEGGEEGNHRVTEDTEEEEGEGEEGEEEEDGSEFSPLYDALGEVCWVKILIGFSLCDCCSEWLLYFCLLD